MKKRLGLVARLCLAACLVSMLPARAAAWGGEGHRMIAKIAKWRLERLRDVKNDARARRALERMTQIFAAHADVYEAPTNIEAAAVWADGVRNNSEAPQYKFSRNLHFVSIPLDPAQDQDQLVMARYCKPNPQVNPVVTGGDCSVAALEHFRQVLLNSNDKEELLEALSFIVHFAGDLHQPLHNAEDQQFENDDNYDGGLGPGLGDRGGNLRYIFYLNYAVFNGTEDSCYANKPVCTDTYPSGPAIKNLHAVWDKHMIQTEMSIYPNQLKKTETKYATFLQNALPSNPSAAAYAQMEAGTPVEWAEEAHDLAEKNAYQLPLKKPKKAPADGKVHDFFYVSNSYRNRNIKIVESQLQKGGVRLAAFLMSAFD